ncbi:MAG: Extracellular ligand-binding receptor [Candidatus Taylorbacteria bacterium]|nr:Extracellular ligand-binding receptor [Candidatus Taylorbacteria bacterium]
MSLCIDNKKDMVYIACMNITKQNIRKAIAVIVLIGIAMVVIIKVHNNAGSSATVSGQGTIKIGGILILSGDGASWGEGSKNGIDLAIEDVNKRGGVNGKKLSISYEDDMGDPQKAISAFRKLTEVDKIKFIIGPNWSPSGIALAALAGTQKTVMISPSLGVKEFNEANKYLFNLWPHDFTLSRTLADYVYSKGHRNVAIFGAQDAWVKDQTNNFKERFEELGGKVSFMIEPKISDTDMRTAIIKTKNDPSIDAVIMTVAGYSLGHIIPQQMKQFSLNLPIFSLNMDKKVSADCGDACDGLTFLINFTPSKEFEARYTKQFGREIGVGADSGYDAVMVLANAMSETKSVDPDVIAAKLASIKEYDGVSGHLISDGKRGFTKPYSIKKVLHGQIVSTDK